jgi:hypothetical protein
MASENMRDFTGPADPMKSRPLVDAGYFAGTVADNSKEAVRRSRLTPQLDVEAATARPCGPKSALAATRLSRVMPPTLQHGLVLLEREYGCCPVVL